MYKLKSNYFSWKFSLKNIYETESEKHLFNGITAAFLSNQWSGDIKGNLIQIKLTQTKYHLQFSLFVFSVFFSVFLTYKYFALE